MSSSSKRSRSGFTLVELLVVIAVIGILVSLLLPAVQAAREAARRSTCQSKMKQLGAAVYVYHELMKVFPPQNVTTVRQHNWASFLLMHLEQENVYNNYDFSVDWNDAKNQTAINTQLEVLQCPSAEPNRVDNIGNGRSGATSDYAPIGAVSGVLVNVGLVPPTRNLAGILVKNGGVAMANVVDGASNTLLFGEDSGRPEFWVKTGIGPNNNNPGCGNYSVSGGRTRGAAWADVGNGMPLHGFTRDGLTCPGPCAINCTNNNEAWSFHPTGMNAVFGDGSVRFLNQEIAIQVYAALITRDGGELLADDQY